MVLNADNGTDYSDKCYISMSACIEDAQAVAKLVEEKCFLSLMVRFLLII